MVENNTATVAIIKTALITGSARGPGLIARPRRVIYASRDTIHDDAQNIRALTMAEMAFSPDVPRRVKGLIKAPINGRINKSASPRVAGMVAHGYE